MSEPVVPPHAPSAGIAAADHPLERTTGASAPVDPALPGVRAARPGAPVDPVSPGVPAARPGSAVDPPLPGVPSARPLPPVDPVSPGVPSARPLPPVDPVSPRVRSAVGAVEAAVAGVARHWLALAFLATAVYVALPVAAPLLAMAGLDRLSDGVYFVYRLACHQFPHRSWFIGGPAWSYDWEAVRAHLGLAENDLLHAYHNPIHDSVMGYQLALCQRDMATFGALLLAMAAYGVVRRHRRIPGLPFRLYLLALVPLALDGLTQLVGLRESTPMIRTLTGALFGAATAMLVLPPIDASFADFGRPAAAPAPDDDAGGPTGPPARMT